MSKGVNAKRCKKTISEFINFTKLAERINNGELLICDKKFYDNQADYIESIIKKLKLSIAVYSSLV